MRGDEFVALDNRTSQMCRHRDGETFLLSEKTVGENYPPLHPRCRSTVAPFIEGMGRAGTRVARVGKKNIEIPAAMNYKDYEKVYIKKEISLAEWNKRNKVSSGVKISELFGKSLPKGLAASDDIMNASIGTSPIKLGNLPDKKLIKPTLEYFENQIVRSDIENAIVITSSNEVYYCSGDKNNINSILELGDKLKGAYVTHNHPVSSGNEHSFSDSDIKFFMDFNLSMLRGIDEKFVYELNRNMNDLDKANLTIEDIINGLASRHFKVIKMAKLRGIGYRRWQRE